MNRLCEDRLLAPVNEYYSKKVRVHGDNHLGVDWNSTESQELRFDQLTKVFGQKKELSVLDFGCGYGHLFGYLRKRRFKCSYIGVDISRDMLDVARSRFGEGPNRKFTLPKQRLPRVDYCVASGVFNVRLKTTSTAWKKYILATLDRFDHCSSKGFAFNCLTMYSDREYMRPYLYYADPCELFKYCKENFSRNVAVLHDYGLFEFTIVVRK